MRREQLLLAGLILALLFIGARPAAALGITEMANGQLITIGEREILSITLPDNMGSAYTWQIAAVDPTVLRHLANSRAGVVGLSATEVLHFMGERPGRSALTLVYADANFVATQAFSVTVEVLPARLY
jgi:predicted secreted protein